MQPLLGRFAGIDKVAKSDNRDYKREYRLFHSSPEAKRNRAKRNLWNRRLKGKVPAGHEIDHKRQLRDGGSNDRGNIRFLSISKNRSEHNRSRVVKDHMRKESSALKGAIIGGGLGGMIGGLDSPDGMRLGNAVKGAFVGGALGGGIGAMHRMMSPATFKLSKDQMAKLPKNFTGDMFVRDGDKIRRLSMDASGKVTIKGYAPEMASKFGKSDLLLGTATKTAAFKQKKYEVDREKVRRDMSRTNKNVGTVIGLTGGTALGGLPKGKLGVAGAVLGGVGGAVLGRKIGSKPISDKKLDRYIRNMGLSDERMSDADLAAYGSAGGAGNMYQLRDRYRKKYEKTASFDPYQWVYDSLIKQAQAVAVKRDPAKWEAAKREAKAKMGGKHSARAMQLATQIYKKRGGTYSGKKPSASSNKLKKWGKQDWKWSGGDKKGEGGKGVYLPKRSASALKSSKAGRAKLRQAEQTKQRATQQGVQFSNHGLHKGKKRSQVS